EDCDLVLLVVDARGLTDEDRLLVDMLRPRADRTILVLNKVDLVKPRARLLPFLDAIAREHDFAAYVPISARRGENLDARQGGLLTRWPRGRPVFATEVL